MKSTRLALNLLVAFALCSGSLAGTAHADPVKCRAAIAKSSAKFVQDKTKALQKCAESIVKRKLGPDPGPGGGDRLAFCLAEPKTSAKIDKSETKAKATIEKACGGGDKDCGTADDDALNDVGWDIGTCPNLENGTCDDAIDDCDDIGDCVTCIGEAAVDQAIELYYDDLEPTNPKVKEEKALNKCQQSIGKSTAKFLAAKSKALQKCWDKINKDKKGAIGAPCPPFGAGDGKAQAAIAKAAEKKDESICKACGRSDKLCGGVDDFTPDEIGFPDTCPFVTAPGTIPEPCGKAIDDLQDLVDCVDCVTEFKVDCISLAQSRGFTNGIVTVPDYPAVCNPEPTATPTPTLTATPTPTVTPTPTLTVAPTLTVTATPTPGLPTLTPTPAPTSTAAGSCPTEVTFVGTAGSLGVLDAGWTGQSHDSQVVANGFLTMAVTGCAGTAPNCGVCDYAGPIENANAGAGEINNQRCSCDSRVPCTANADCPGSCECVFHFGSYLPLSAGGVSTCVKNNFQGPVTGTFNEDTGTSAGSALLLSTVWTGPTADDPCPKCLGDGTANDGTKGGTCSGGQDPGAACDIMGTHPNAIFGDTSLDCRPAIGGEVAFLDIDLSNTTGTLTRTLSAANPNCTAPGFTGQKCHCDTCNNANAEACSSNADCLPSGGNPGICGGRRCIGGTNSGGPCVVPGAGSECPGGSCGRPGKATAPNECDGGVGDCALDSGNEWACVSGPSEQFCTPSAIHKACTVNADCTVPGDTCVGKSRNCYNNGQLGDSVTATGVADPPVGHAADPTLAALFCIGPTTAPAVNSVAGLPGLGRLELPGHATDNGTGP